MDDSDLTVLERLERAFPSTYLTDEAYGREVRRLLAEHKKHHERAAAVLAALQRLLDRE